jgi:hypothetical protein
MLSPRVTSGQFCEPEVQLRVQDETRERGFVIALFLPALFGTPDGYEAARLRMVRVDIEARGVRSAT